LMAPVHAPHLRAMCPAVAGGGGAATGRLAPVVPRPTRGKTKKIGEKQKFSRASWERPRACALVLRWGGRRRGACGFGAARYYALYFPIEFLTGRHQGLSLCLSLLPLSPSQFCSSEGGGEREARACERSRGSTSARAPPRRKGKGRLWPNPTPNP
jgi:hypothetical protein